MSFLLWSGRAIGYRRTTAGLLLAAALFGGGVLAAPAQPFDHPRRLALSALLFVGFAAVLAWSAAMAQVGVQISLYNVRIRHGLLPMPPISVPLRMVNSLRAVDVQSSLAQRWGWTWIPGQGRTVIVRSGPALMFDFGGRQFTVSVDDPDAAVAALKRVR